MIAKIRNKDKVYDSVVFAVSYKSRKSKVIVFDETYNKLIVLNYSWNSEIDVMFTNYDTENYRINEDKFKVYWNNKNFFKLVENEQYGEDILQEAKNMQSKIVKKEWYEVNNNYDLQGLFFTVGDFHDACVIKINEKEQYTEILIDTTWGFYVLLKCYDVIDNTLDLNYYFQDCKYSYKDGIIEILFDDEFSGLEQLKCKKIEYKYYYERKYKVNSYSIENEMIVINNNKKDEIKIYLNLIDREIFSTAEKANIGMMQYFDNLSTYTFVLEDTFIVLKIYPKQNEHIEEYKKRVENIKNELVEKDLFLYDIYQEELFEDDRESFGNVIFEEQQSDYSTFFYMFKYTCIPVIGNIIFWLIIQLCNPQMDWILFYVFGLGISFVVSLMILIIGLVQYPKMKNTISLYEDGVVCRGIVNITLAYSSILEIRNGKKIVLVTNFGEFKMLRSRNNNKIYEILLEKINENKN